MPYTHMGYVWCVQCVHQGTDAGIILRCKWPNTCTHFAPNANSRFKSTSWAASFISARRHLFFSHIHTLQQSTHSLAWAHEPTILATRPTATNPWATQHKWNGENKKIRKTRAKDCSQSNHSNFQRLQRIRSSSRNVRHKAPVHTLHSCVCALDTRIDSHTARYV